MPQIPVDPPLPAPAHRARNIEIKAKLDDLPAARRIAEGLATDRLGVQIQVDTYFHARQGRLKLREMDGETAQLVSYARPDESSPKASDYTLAPVESPELTKSALAAALGVSVVVRKRREILLHKNVRIHLDEVEGLGEFLEFEAVLDDARDEDGSRALLDWLMGQFGLAQRDLLTGSYSDMLLPRN